VAGLVLAAGLAPAAAAPDSLPGLFATSPMPGGAERLSLFAPLLGHWRYDYRFRDAGGHVIEQGTGTWDFAWIVNGRSMQDVQTFRTAAGALSEFGTTLRVPQPDGSWRVVWDGPMRRNFCELTARRASEDIRMDGHCNGDPALERWVFSDVGSGSFQWRGYLSPDAGRHWRLEEEISARR
jgi:hypothetical protein